MTIELFILLLGVLEVVNPLITQGLKITLDNMKTPYNATKLSLGVAIVCSMIVGTFMYQTKQIEMNLLNVYYLFFLMIANWLGSTIGYDKVMMCIKNLK